MSNGQDDQGTAEAVVAVAQVVAVLKTSLLQSGTVSNAVIASTLSSVNLSLARFGGGTAAGKVRSLLSA